MNLDYGRKADLDELYHAFQRAGTSSEKRKIEDLMNGILQQSKATRQLRDELVKAVRAGDIIRATRCRNELRRQKADKFNNNIQL